MRNNSRRMRHTLFVVAALAVLLYAPMVSATPILGDALASFAVLGAAGVTNVATSSIGGNLGSAPNASVGGGYIFTSGSLQANTAAAQQAQLDLDAAISAVNAGSADFSVTDGDLIAWQNTHGDVIAPGTYDVAAASIANIPGLGNLILDGAGNYTAVWRFRLASTLVTSTTSNVTVQNVGDGSNVGIYWSVGSAATLNGPTFAGNVLAHDLISSDGDLKIDCGRLLSATTQVTLIHDKISIAGCIGNLSSGGYDQGVNIGSGGTGGSNGQVVGQVPEPASMLLLGLGLIGLAGVRKRMGI